MSKGSSVAAILGGDQREITVGEILSEKYNIDVRFLGRPETGKEGIDYLESPEETCKNADLLHLGVPGIDEDGFLKKTYIDRKVRITPELLALTAQHCQIFVGVDSVLLKELADRAERKVVAMMDDDQVAILNSIPTAEGIIQMAMEKAPITIHSSRCIVLGLGRCGLTLARLLLSMGAETIGVARRREVRARGIEIGLKSIPFTELSAEIDKADFIFNTVPVPVINRDLLVKTQPDVYIFDIASPPGGVDFEMASELDRWALLAPGLPGRVAPKTAGEYLADYIIGQFKNNENRGE